MIAEWVQPLWNRGETHVPSPGLCIYCGRFHISKLSDEHVIAYSLNGSLILDKSSCRICAGKINKFEQPALKLVYGSARFALLMNTRARAKDRKKTTKVTIYRDGEPLEVEVHIDDWPPFVIPFLDIGKPIALTGLNVPGYDSYKFSLTFVPNPNGKFPEWGQTIRMKDEFIFKSVAKKAHSFASAVLGPRSFEHWLKPVLFGPANKSFTQLVGSSDEPCPYPNVLHYMNLEILERFMLGASGGNIRAVSDKIVVVKIWLFAKFIKRPYVVVVGRLTGEGGISSPIFLPGSLLAPL